MPSAFYSLFTSAFNLKQNFKLSFRIFAYMAADKAEKSGEYD